MKSRVIGISTLVVVFAVIAYFTAALPTADFYETFYSAARSVFSGHSPYLIPGYLYPPWGTLLLFPFAWMPVIPAHGIYFAACLFMLVAVAWRLHASPITIAAFILSPTAIGALLVGNLDPMIVSGMLLPPALGLLVLFIKPQIGVGVGLYYLIDFIRTRHYLDGLKTFAPVIAGYALSLAIFPVWLVRMVNNPSNPWNRSFFPYSISIGLFLLWLALRKRNPYFALASTPFLAPYLSFYTYLVVQVGLLHEDVEKYIRRDVLQILLCIFLWTIMLVFKL